MTDPEPTSTRQAPRLWLWATLVILLVAGALVAWAIVSGRLPVGAPSFRGQLIEPPDLAHDFTLTAQDGQPLSLSDLRSKVVLLYFGYTFCPDVCPTTMNELKKAREALGDQADELQVIMITVDPQRDTPEVLREYVAHFHPSFMGLTGTEGEIQAAVAPYGIFVNRHEGTAATGYLVDHTSSVLAIDKQGYWRLIYGFDKTGEDIAADVRRLLRE